MKLAFRLRLVCVPALTMLLFILSGCASSPAVKSARYMASGKKLLAANDSSRAILQFRNAMQATPNDPEVYYQLGLAFAAAKDFRSSVAAFEKTLAINPKHAAARLKIAQMKAATNDRKMLQDAQGSLEELVQSEADQLDVLNTLAFTELKLGQTDSAIGNLERAVKQAPADLRAYVLLSSASLSSGDLGGAEGHLKDAVNVLPKSAEAHRALGEFYLTQHRGADAQAQFQRALQLDPKNGPALMNLAQIQLAAGDAQEAERNFKTLSGLYGYHSIYAVFLFKQGRRDEAFREFERLVKQNPDDRYARTNLIVAYRMADRPADIDRVLGAAIKKNPKDTDALLQRAEIEIQRRDFVQAEIDLNRVLPFRPEAEVHYLLAKLNQARDNAMIYKQELETVLNLNPRLQSVRVELARLLITTKAGSQAALDYLNAPQANPHAVPVIEARNWALWNLGDLAQFRKGVDDGLAQERSPDLLIQDGLWKLRTGDAVHARASIEEALKIDPANVRGLDALNKTYARKDAAVAIQKLKEYAAREPKSAAVQDFLAMMLLAQGDKVQARTVLTAVKALDPRSTKADLSLVQLDVADGRLPEARQRLEGVLAQENGNLVARMWLGIVQEHLGDYNKAIGNLRQVVDLEPHAAQASNNLAYLLTENQHQPDLALKYAEKAVELEPGDPAFQDTLGWILYHKGQYAQAVQHLEIACAKAGNAIWKYHLAMAYAKGGNVSRGKSVLEAALKIDPQAPEAKTARELFGTLQ